MDDLAGQVAAALIEIGAVRFTPSQPVRFASGLLSPIYVDNRRLPFHPEAWRLVIAGFERLIADRALHPDVIAGIEAAGIPHSAALAYRMQKPSVFVRKQPKDHGAMKRVEGGDVSGKAVLLIEDHVTTGGSSLSGVEGLRAEGAVVRHCLTITGYGFPQAAAAFEEAGVGLHVLCELPDLLEVALQMGRFDRDALALILDWSHDPHGWTARQESKA
jgi:orotate phosphoribosyltransferase